ncbi:MAG: ankyrin repeat domain-containing protein [Desulfomonile tiedjei]|nr:ankyrin repeat domain-containing protein [Desulfomonile tiedjei]
MRSKQGICSIPVLACAFLLGLSTSWAHAEDLDNDLLKAVSKFDEKAVGQLLDKGANPNFRDARGYSTLMMACSSVNPVEGSGAAVISMTGVDVRKRVAEALLAKGADVNFRSQEGRTSLMLAATEGYVPHFDFSFGSGKATAPKATIQGSPTLVRLLLANGADKLIKDASGKTALDLARECAARGENGNKKEGGCKEVVELLMSESK